MIISHKHRFIFLKTMRTAGTSVELALSEICGPHDILTPIRSALEQERAYPARNYRIDHPLKPRQPRWRSLLGRPERHYHPSVGYFEHIHAATVRVYVGESVWRRYFKFAFVRNPWDRQVSFYYYKTRHDRRRRSFEAFLANQRRAHVESLEIYGIDGTSSVDFLGRYESLHTDFAEVLAQIGVNEPIALPHKNASVKPTAAYRELYSYRTMGRVADWYADEIRQLGYTF